MSKEITIIDKTKPPSPRFIFSPPPTFKTNLERLNYRAEEKRRCFEGYNGLTPYHYFYLTQCFIKIGTAGLIERPQWRDCDGWILEGFHEARKRMFDMLLLSRREIGKTTIGGGLLPNYFMRMFPGSTSIMTSCDKDRIYNMFTDKTIVTFQNLSPDFAPKNMSKRQTKNDVALEADYGFLDQYGEKKVGRSRLFCKETVLKPDGFSSIRAIYGYYDEIALHERAQQLMESSQSCYMEGTQKTGTMFSAGTIEAGVPQESVNMLREIVGNSEISKTVVLLAPYWWGLKEFMVNGHSDEKKGKEWWDKECERLEKSTIKSAIKSFKKNYPPDLETALDTATSGTLPEECLAILSEQRKRIMRDKPPIQTYRLFRNEEGKVEYEPDKNGKFYILTLPDENKDYSSGTDPIPFGNANLTDGSDYAIIISEDDTGTDVAYYAERNMNPDIVFENCSLLQDFYFGVPTLLETDRGEVIYEKYKDNESLELLEYRPTTLGIKFTDKRKKRGVKQSESLSAKQNALHIKDILENGHNIWFSRVIDEYEQYLIKNTDLISARGMMLLMRENKIKKATNAMPKPEFKKIPVFGYDSSGRTQITWKEQRIDAKQ